MPQCFPPNYSQRSLRMQSGPGFLNPDCDRNSILYDLKYGSNYRSNSHDNSKSAYK